MPYITKELRAEIDPRLNVLLKEFSDNVEDNQKDGCANYIITRFIDHIYGNGGYADFNRGVGTLESVKQEFWDRKIRTYEDDKIRESGDVYLNAVPTERNLAWAAGFFEGEGCFYAGYHPARQDGTKVFRTHASLTQKDVTLLEQFKNIVGFGVICNSSADVKAWKTTRVGEASKILEWFRPWLSDRRITTAEKLLTKENSQIFRPLANVCSKGTRVHTREHRYL